MNIHTAGDLARADVSLIRKRFNVVLQRTAYELRGLSCLELEEIEPKQSIISSKSFGTLQTGLQALTEAVSSHVMRAWEKMRAQNLVPSYLSVFILSNRFRADLPQYSNSIGFKLVTPTDDLRKLTTYAKDCLKKIYKEGIHYKKAGVLLDGLIPKNPRQTDLFHPDSDLERLATDKLMDTITLINSRFGRQTIKLAAEGYSKPWAMRRELKSPGYTTQWTDLPIVYCRHHKAQKARRSRLYSNKKKI